MTWLQNPARYVMRTAEVALAGMLSALSIAIPLVFRGTPLQIYIPALQYSGTVASHVPSMLAIAVGPVAAVVVGLASTIGFAATLGPIVAARAFTHVIWGLAAAIYVSRGGSYVKGLLLVALPIHAVGEGIVVFALGPLFGAIQVAAETAGLLVFAGTLIHHLIDSVISIAVLRVVKPLLVPLLPHLAHTKLVWSVAIRKGPLTSRFVRRRKATVSSTSRSHIVVPYRLTGSGQ